MPARGVSIGLAAALGLAGLTAGAAHPSTGAAAANTARHKGATPAHRLTHAGRAAADPAGIQPVTETFTGATAPEFIGYNEACLTGAPQGAPPHGDHGLADASTPSRGRCRRSTRRRTATCG